MRALREKTALITGATGLIGSYLAKRLLEEGARVIAVGRNGRKLKDVFQDKLNDTNFSYVEADIVSKIPDEIGKVDFIFHAASPIAGQEVRELPVNVIEANLFGVKNCLEYLKRQKEERGHIGRLIVFSSVTVYGSGFVTKELVTEDDTYMTESLSSPSASYCESKRMVEVMAQAYCRQYDVDSVIVRIGYVYGYTKCCPNTAFYNFIDKAINGKEIVLKYSNLARRDNIYITDVINALVTVCLKGQKGEAYNISSAGEKGNYKAIDEIAVLIADSVETQTGNHIEVIRKQDRDGRKRGIVIDNQKLKGLGWVLEVDIEDGLRKTIQQYLKQERR